jgi:hypothetical protein
LKSPLIQESLGFLLTLNHHLVLLLKKKKEEEEEEEKRKHIQQTL